MFFTEIFISNKFFDLDSMSWIIFSVNCKNFVEQNKLLREEYSCKQSAYSSGIFQIEEVKYYTTF